MDKLIVNSLKELKESKFNLSSYDVYIVFFSGGKDSIAAFLYLLEQGVSVENIELWHHDIDGREGSKFMDWPITRDYCKEFAKAFGVKIYFSWKKYGFEGEMLRENSLTAPTIFEDGDGNLIEVGGLTGKKSTRRKFPQVAADLKVRWCSSYLKIDVGSAAIRNQKRFNGKRILTLSGERAEESSARSKYNVLEPDRADNRDGKSKRLVDRLRPVKEWSETDIWAIIAKYKIRVHPAYYLGWGRVSCMFCIFGNANQWASANVVSPAGTNKVNAYEKEFGCTIKRKESIDELIEKGKPYESITDELIKMAMGEEYSEDIFFKDEEKWVLPAGAFGDSCGPT